MGNGDREVTAKAVERVTEAIGADIARRQQEAIQQTMQLELPVAMGQPIPKMYVQMDGTGLPVVSAPALAPEPASASPERDRRFPDRSSERPGAPQWPARPTPGP